MKITLDTRNEINNYFNYLIESNTLFDQVPEVILADAEADSYLSWLSSVDPTTETESAKSKKHWSDDDIAKLSNLIASKASLITISNTMGRTVDSIRSYARNRLNMVIVKGVWRDVNYTTKE